MLEAATMKAIFLSTGHITKRDADILAHEHLSLPRTNPHRHGYIIFVCSGGVAAQVETLRGRGHSEALIKVYELAAADPAVLLIDFDSDGDLIDGLEIFDW